MLAKVKWHKPGCVLQLKCEDQNGEDRTMHNKSSFNWITFNLFICIFLGGGVVFFSFSPSRSLVRCQRCEGNTEGKFPYGASLWDGTRMERIRCEDIRGTARLRCCGDKVREARPRWFGRVQREDVGIRLSKNAGVGAARQEVKGKSKEEVYGCRSRSQLV